MYLVLSQNKFRNLYEGPPQVHSQEGNFMLWSITTYSTFAVLFSHGHCLVIGPPKIDDSLNLDDDSIFSPVPQKCM